MEVYKDIKSYVCFFTPPVVVTIWHIIGDSIRKLFNRKDLLFFVRIQQEQLNSLRDCIMCSRPLINSRISFSQNYQWKEIFHFCFSCHTQSKFVIIFKYVRLLRTQIKDCIICSSDCFKQLLMSLMPRTYFKLLLNQCPEAIYWCTHFFHWFIY